MTYTKLFEAVYTFPELETLDWLLIMGGAMACYEEDTFPFLAEEKSFIRRCIQAGKTVVGICLGSQLLAECLGAKVYPSTHQEIGFLPVALNPSAMSHPLVEGLPSVMNLFQWHGDTFDLPEGATLLATSEACKHQAYVKGKCLGMQFHWEADEKIIKSMIEADRHELVQAPYVMQEEEILSDLPKLNLTTPLLFQFLDRVALP